MITRVHILQINQVNLVIIHSHKASFSILKNNNYTQRVLGVVKQENSSLYEGQLFENGKDLHHFPSYIYMKSTD